MTAREIRTLLQTLFVGLVMLGVMTKPVVPLVIIGVCMGAFFVWVMVTRDHEPKTPPPSMYVDLIQRLYVSPELEKQVDQSFIDTWITPAEDVCRRIDDALRTPEEYDEVQELRKRNMVLEKRNRQTEERLEEIIWMLDRHSRATYIRYQNFHQGY